MYCGREGVWWPGCAPIRINQECFGIKSTGNSWHKALSTTLASMNFEPRRAEPDISLRMSTDLRGEKYWEWIVIYIEDLLAISEEPKAIMDYFSMYNLKDRVSPLDQYLGANAGKWQFLDGSNFWWMNGRYCITNAINPSKNIME